MDDADADDADDSDFEKIMEKIFEDVDLEDIGKNKDFSIEGAVVPGLLHLEKSKKSNSALYWKLF